MFKDFVYDLVYDLYTTEVEFRSKLFRDEIEHALSKLRGPPIRPPPMSMLTRSEAIWISGLSVKDGSHVLYEPHHNGMKVWKSTTDMRLKRCLERPVCEVAWLMDQV